MTEKEVKNRAQRVRDRKEKHKGKDFSKEESDEKKVELVFSMKEKSETRDSPSDVKGSDEKVFLNSDLKPQPDDEVPKTLGEAKKGKFWKGFEEAIETEMSNLKKNKT